MVICEEARAESQHPRLLGGVQQQLSSHVSERVGARERATTVRGAGSGSVLILLTLLRLLLALSDLSWPLLFSSLFAVALSLVGAGTTLILIVLNIGCGRKKRLGRWPAVLQLGLDGVKEERKAEGSHEVVVGVEGEDKDRDRNKLQTEEVTGKKKSVTIAHKPSEDTARDKETCIDEREAHQREAVQCEIRQRAPESHRKVGGTVCTCECVQNIRNKANRVRNAEKQAIWSDQVVAATRYNFCRVCFFRSPRKP